MGKDLSFALSASRPISNNASTNKYKSKHDRRGVHSAHSIQSSGTGQGRTRSITYSRCAANETVSIHDGCMQQHVGDDNLSASSRMSDYGSIRDRLTDRPCLKEVDVVYTHTHK
mmetsp:Transcript_15814/g.24067  ORF Transcript_15814/g.24067 Transcript_15814/m.24067 type:complete len:114 (+) Transcript_15814:243-584(+)